jgi:hypothetical protein
VKVSDELGRAMKAKRGRGRPETTGSSTTPLVQYRVSKAQHAELCTEAKKLRVTANEVARRRAFPLEAVKPTEDAARAGYSWELGPAE